MRGRQGPDRTASAPHLAAKGRVRQGGQSTSGKAGLPRLERQEDVRSETPGHC